MSKSNTAIFDEAVAKFFAPIAVKAKLAVHKIANGVHEMQSSKFNIRIRSGTGHRRDLLITLLPTDERRADIDDLSNEIGLGVVAAFCRERLPEAPTDSKEEYMRSAERLAEVTERLLLPYVLGLKTDFAELKQFVAQRVEKAVKEIPEYRLPKNARKEWL